MQCKDIMKQVVECVGPHESVRVAAIRMRAQNVGFLPVCDEDGVVIGALTDRDLAMRVLADGVSVSTPIAKVMSHGAVCCRPEDELQRAEQLMGDNHKSRIICTDEAGRLLGVISLSDIAQHETAGYAARTMRQITSREVRPFA